MKRRILVPLDGSTLADGVLPQVRRMLVARDAHVILLSVIPDGAGDAADVERRAREARDHLAGIKDDLVAAGASVEVEVRPGAPAAVIVERARQEQASLVVMATHGRSGLSRLLRGSVAEQVVRACPVPVLLANPRAATPAAGRVQKVLVPLDGSKLADAILPAAIEVGQAFDAEVLLFFADWALPAGEPFGPAIVTRTPGEVEEMLKAQREQVERAGLRVRVVAGWGPPAEAILDVAAREAVDLIAMSTHGLSGLTRLVFGSTAEAVLRSCASALLVRRALPIPTPATADA